MQVIKLAKDICKWLMDNCEPYSVTLYISSDKKIEMTPMDVHLTLALPIDGRKVEEFYGKKPKDTQYKVIVSVWREEWNLEGGTPKPMILKFI